MSDFNKDAEWKNLGELLRALGKARDKLTTEEYTARLNECVRIDSGNKEAVANGCQGWVNQEIRSRYLASIMAGRILIGS